MGKHTKGAPIGEREAVEVVARLMHWKGRHPNPWRVVARMYSECAAGAYPNEWEEGAPLMTVAQHERITAALAAEVERLKRENANIRVKWTEYGRELEAEVQRLREALEGMLEYFPEGASDGECFAVDAARAALAASTEQEGDT